MTSIRATVALVVTMASAGGRASAQPKPPAPAAGSIDGNYEVKYEQVSSNCSNTGLTLERGVINLKTDKTKLYVNPNIGVTLEGSTMRASGKFRASSKVGPTAIQGLDGKYSAAGRVDNGLLQMVFVAEYYQGKRPLCTQSWNASGLRADKLK